MVQNLPESSAARVAKEPPWREVFSGGSPEHERALFEGYARDIEQLQRWVERRSKSRRIMRGFHAKMVLGTRAELSVSEELSAALRTGFLEGDGPREVIVRFSASSHEDLPDRKRNGRGIALRIEHRGQSYDLLFSDSPASYARDAAQFMLFVRVLSAPWRIVTLFHELGIREAARLLRGVFAQTFRAKTALNETRFWGKTPMLIDQQAVKYQLVPLDPKQDPLPVEGNHFMRDALIGRMAREDVRYTLCIQRFVNETATPLEDHSVKWSEQDAPLEPVATLLIRRGTFAAQPAELEALIERMAFNPWNTIAAMRPLGSLNRARQFVYAASANQRALAGTQQPVDGWPGRIQQRFTGALSASSER